jgi:hypothetical protein
MPKDATFTLKLDPALRDAPQLVRNMMRDFIASQQETEDYETFLCQKVELARASLQAGKGLTNTEVEAAFAARRARSV